MRVSFNPSNLYNYSPRVNGNNAESGQKIQGQSNNYDLTFGQSKWGKIGNYCLTVLVGTVLSFCLKTAIENSIPEPKHNTNFHSKLEETGKAFEKAYQESKNAIPTPTKSGFLKRVKI